MGYPQYGLPPNPVQGGEKNWVAIVSAFIGAIAVIVAAVITVAFATRGEAGPDPVAPPVITEPSVTPKPAVTSKPAPVPTTIVKALGDIVVPGRLANGVQYTAPESTTYRFQYKGGAYSTYPNGQSGPNGRPWRTAIFVYKGDRALFTGEDIDKSHADLIIADTTDTASQTDAVNLATGTSWVEMQLRAGETITLVAVDNIYAYGDNPGSVTLAVSTATRTTV